MASHHAVHDHVVPRAALNLVPSPVEPIPAPPAEAAAIPRWHFAMLNDAARNEAFAEAITRHVVPGSHVLDIGSGTGLLAMMAAHAGAAHVTTCEANPQLAALAREVIELHELSHVITVVPKLSNDLVVGLDLPRRADLIVSEIVDCGLIGEGLLPAVRHARRHLLADGGRLLPASSRVLGCLVESEVVTRLNRVTTAAGYDVRPLNRFATAGHFPVRLNTWPHRLLSEPQELVRFDLESDPLGDGLRHLSATATEDGVVHGVVAWFELDLGGTVLHNGPDVPDTHWMQAFLPWEGEVALRAGDDLDFDLQWQHERLTARPLLNGKAHA
jgi:SAM-dependent methyltransferase